MKNFIQVFIYSLILELVLLIPALGQTNSGKSSTAPIPSPSFSPLDLPQAGTAATGEEVEEEEDRDVLAPIPLEELERIKQQQIQPNLGPGITIDASTTKESKTQSFPLQLGTNFQAIGMTNSIPPDPHVTAGPNHILATVNSKIACFTKSGTPVFSITFSTWFNNVPHPSSIFDARLIYDYNVGRFIFICDARQTSNSTTGYLISISANSDPTGTWQNYSIDAGAVNGVPSGLWADFPTVGYDSIALYISSNDFAFSDNSFSYSKVKIINKDSLYQGHQLVWKDVVFSPGEFTVAPVFTVGSAPAMYFVTKNFSSGSGMTLMTVTDPLGTPSILRQGIGIRTFGTQPNATQPSGVTAINTGDGRIGSTAWYRDGLIYLTFGENANFGSGTVAAMRYVKVNVSTLTAVIDETFGADGYHYYYPSVAVDDLGDVYFSFSRSNASEFASAHFSGRTIADANIQASMLMKAGTATYLQSDGTRNRWGDYLGCVPDPADGRKAWFIGEHASNVNQWNTWIGSATLVINGAEGNVYKDFDGNPATTGDRSAVANWRVRFTDGTTQLDSVTTTSGNGAFSFTTINDGSYELYLAPVSPVIGNQYKYIGAVAGSGGSVQTVIDSAHIHVELASGEVSSGNAFLLFQKSSITGTLFNDRNGNGTQDGGELPLSGWIVYLNGPVNLLDTTDASGNYGFSSLLPGEYTVGESLKSGWVVTTPNGVSKTDTLKSNVPFTTLFGNFKLGSIAGVKFRDSDQDRNHDLAEPGIPDWQIVKQGLSAPAETVSTDANGNYSFNNLTYDVYTITEVMKGPGWGQTKPGTPNYSYTVTLRSGLDTTGLDFGNFPLDSVMYRTATMEDWALAQDAKGHYKSIKKKADKVEVKFNLNATSTSLLLEFSTAFNGTVYRGKAKTEVLATLAGGLKKYTLTGLAVTPPESIQIEGIGAKGKRIKVKYAFGTDAKVTLPDASYKLNQPRNPMPNLHNAGEEMFIAGAFSATGLRTGLGGAHTVGSFKYKDVQKSLNKKGLIHDGAARCLNTFDGSLKPILTQQSSLARDKHNNKLFAEVVALKLNLRASQLGYMAVGLGSLIYNDTSMPAFYNKSVSRIVGQADSFMTNCSQVTPKGATPDDYYNVIHAINGAFADTIDTVSFSGQTVFTGAKHLVDVPLLRPNPLAIEPKIEYVNLNYTEQTPLRYTLYQNYPNPFNPMTTIEFDLADQAIVTLKIYNILGQEVATLIDHEIMDDGNQEIEFDGSNMASGVYFYRILAQGFDEDGLTQTFQNVKKMLLIR